LGAEEVIDELDEFDDDLSDFEFEDDGPLMEGSGDELEDLQSDEREKEMYGENDEYEEGMTADEEREHNTDDEGERKEEEGDEEEGGDEEEEEEEEEEDGEGREGRPSTSTTGVRWKSKTRPIHVEPFEEPIGPTFLISPSPAEVFGHFFTSTICDHIVQQSNLYASQVMGSERFASWDPITADELRAFFGFCICMGVVRLPAVRHYWS